MNVLLLMFGENCFSEVDCLCVLFRFSCLLYWDCGVVVIYGFVGLVLVLDVVKVCFCDMYCCVIVRYFCVGVWCLWWFECFNVDV